MERGSALRLSLPDGLVARRAQLGERRTVGQGLQNAGLHDARRPPQQVRAGGLCPRPQGKPADLPVGEHDHARGEPVDEVARQGVLRCRVGTGDRIEDGVGGTLGHRHHSGPGEGCLLALHDPRTPEEPGVLLRVGHIQAGTVDGHRPVPAEKCPRGSSHRQAASPPSEKSTSSGSAPSRARAWKMADFEGRTGSSSPVVHARPSVRRPSTSSYEPSACSAMSIAKYPIVRAGNERFRCSVRWQPATTSSTSPGGNVRVSTPHRNHIGEPSLRHGLSPTGAGHTARPHPRNTSIGVSPAPASGRCSGSSPGIPFPNERSATLPGPSWWG